MGNNKELQQKLAEHVSGQANSPLSKPAHSLTYDDLADELDANKNDGLTSSEAEGRLGQYGPNELGNDGGVNPTKILLRQIVNSMTLVSVELTDTI